MFDNDDEDANLELAIFIADSGTRFSWRQARTPSPSKPFAGRPNAVFLRLAFAAGEG